MGFFDIFATRAAPAVERREPTLHAPAISAASIENPSTSFSNPAEWLGEALAGGSKQSFGPSVTERTAMAVSVVFRCVTLRAGIRATLPLKVYRRTPEGREEAPEHRLARMLKVAPYPGRPLTAFAWRELLSANVDLWGNHYSIIRYDAAARVVGFEPVMPWNVEVLRRGSRNLYRCVLEDGTVEYVDHEDMLHIPGPGFDGICGMSRIRFAARDSIALAKILEQQTGQIHENAARPSGTLSLPASITKEGLARLRAQFSEAYSGRANAGKVLFTDPGSEFKPMQMTPEDLATLEFRRFQIADISRFFGVPLHLLNEVTGSTSWGTGLSEQTLAFLIFGIDPDLSRDEAELNYKLFDGSDYYCEYDRSGLLAMDPLKAAQVAQTEISFGGLLPNEYRKIRNRPPVEGGDEPLVNSTNIPLSRALAPAAPATEPVPQETAPNAP